MTWLFYFVSIKIKICFALSILIFTSKTLGEDSEFIVFGQSAALSGPAMHLGQNMRRGILSAFESVNKEGGIHGKKLQLISLDDAYEPEKAVQNTRDLIGEKKVFALIGGVGTPTSKAALPILSLEGVPYIAPLTGAEFLRQADSVINIRSSYKQEIQNIADQLVGDLSIKKISILYQDDSYGRSGLKELSTVLKNKNIEIASQGVYLRNTTAVKTALLEIMEKSPKAVVIVGAYKAAAKFIQLAKTLNFRPIFICISFVGAKALALELKNHPSYVLISQVVPHPFDASNSLVKNYQKAVQKDFNFVSLEGYIAGRLAVQVLKLMGPHPKQEDFLKIIRQNKKFSIDGFVLNYGPQDNQGSDKVFFTALRRGKFFPINKLTEIFNKKPLKK